MSTVPASPRWAAFDGLPLVPCPRARRKQVGKQSCCRNILLQ
ncbi:hypothetical protein U9M48_010061 [Paspalum notatum var. saurae]|uniref:Uncharacterized protein n=1 Tax=Paspalum notatum var. saurae TaxID=547442 RepID=A0AAQ3SSA9_PASNO